MKGNHGQILFELDLLDSNFAQLFKGLAHVDERPLQNLVPFDRQPHRFLHALEIAGDGFNGVRLPVRGIAQIFETQRKFKLGGAQSFVPQTQLRL